MPQEHAMTTEFPLDIFPVQLFPDAEVKRVSLEAATLTITVSDSDWALSEDEELFFGPGDMIFQYTGAATLGWRSVQETGWHGGGPELLTRLTALDFIRRQPDGSWLFQFSCRAQGFVVSLLLEKITRIDWTGDADEDLLALELPPVPE